MTLHSSTGTATKFLSFKYDGMGRRIFKSFTDLVNSGNSYTRHYYYDNQSIIEERDVANHIVALYVHGPGVDNPLVMVRDTNGDHTLNPTSEAFFYTKDALGSIRDLTDSTGKLVQRYRYSGYGNTTVELDDRDPLRIQ